MNIYISGTSRGIGEALGKYYKENGVKVFGIARSPKNIDINQIECDLTQYDEMKIKIKEQLKDIKSLDLIILNAGILGDINLLKESDLNDMKRTMEVNLWSQKVLLDLLLEYKPKTVIAISSGAAIKGSPGWSGYSLSKAALNMLVQLYASEVNETKFIALAPGLVDTSMQETISKIDSHKFPNFKRIQNSRNTENMPGPDDFIKIYKEKINEILMAQSGSFIDIRHL